MEKELTVMTTEQAAKYLVMSEYSLRELCRKKMIPHARVGTSHYRFTLESLNQWLREQEEANYKVK